MPQDAVTLRRQASDLNELFYGAKVNKITQPSKDEIVLYLYSPKKSAKLLICSNALFSRVGITEIDKKNPVTAPSFCMLLRKHLLNASIKNISAITDERIIKIVFDGKNDFMESVEKELYCEVMGKYSNVIFCENEIILGTLKTSSLELNKDRVLLSGAKYSLPKSQEKTSIFNKEAFLSIIKSFNGGNLDDFIFNNVTGFALNTAKEAVTRFYGKTSFDGEIKKSEEFYNSILSFLDDDSTLPVCCAVNGKITDYFFCDYQTISGEKTSFERISEAETFFFDQKQLTREFNDAQNKLISIVNAKLKKEYKKLDIIEKKIIACDGAEQKRRCGELITANIYKIKRGDKYVLAEDYYNDNASLKIPLDEELSPNANAQKYFKIYTKLKNTLKAVQPQKEQALTECDYLESVLSELNACTTQSDLIEIKEELTQSGIIESDKKTLTKNKKNSETLSYREYEFNGFTIRAGKNNIQNDKLTFSSKPSDTWLHAKDYHSAHVVIETNGKHTPDDIILIAAEICAFYSEAKNGTKVPIDYTLKKYVKKPPKAKYGSVIYTDFKTIFVTPDSHFNLAKK